MKKIVFLFVLTTATTFGQEKQFQSIDDRVKNYRNFTSIEQLAYQIASDFPSDIERIRAAYSWVATHISYSYRNPFYVGSAQFYIITDEDDYQRRLKREDQKTALKTFKDRKATCKGFALLFQKICQQLNIESHVILGYVKESPQSIGFMPEKKNHAWNAAKINNQWIFLDVTAASGYKIKGVWQQRFSSIFFDLKKEVLADTYFAEDSSWREKVEPITLKMFSQLPKFSSAYFYQNFEVLSPRTGSIESPKTSKIVLEIKGIDSGTKIKYQYGEGSVKNARSTHRNSVSKIELWSPRKDGILKIFFNDQEALNYKVKVKD
jgi:transglutaminase/protease-like cytokinesis protein 3